MKIRKAVIPVAGLGTRFLPVTKTVPKELLPIVDKPILLYNVEEIVAAGIEELILVSGRGKTAIEDFFDTSYELEDTLAKSGKSGWLKHLREITAKLKVVSIRQGSALGLGHAILTAQPAVGDEPFAVLLGDELMISHRGQASGIGQLIDVFTETKMSAVAVMEVEDSEVGKYGIVDVTEKAPRLWSVNDVVEKPAPGKAPSRLALPGRYVFDNEIFNCLREVKPGRNGELQLTDGMALLAKRKGLLATTLDVTRYDAGDKLGYLMANVELGLDHPEIGAAFQSYLKNKFGGRS